MYGGYNVSKVRGEMKIQMKKETLCANTLIDFRKIIVYILVIGVSGFSSYGDSTSLSFAVIVQGICNIDCFWDFLEDKDICRKLKGGLKFSIMLSVFGILIALFNMIRTEIIFGSPIYGIAAKIVAFVFVAFPIVIFISDHGKNNKLEQKKEQGEVNGGEEDEL